MLCYKKSRFQYGIKTELAEIAKDRTFWSPFIYNGHNSSAHKTNLIV